MIESLKLWCYFDYSGELS